MQILSKGYKLPQSGDYGTVFWPSLAFDIQQLNDHHHDGVDGALIESMDVKGSIVAISAGSFVDQGDGYFRATATIVPQITTKIAKMRDPTTYEQIHGKIQKASANAVYVYMNIPQDVEVIFGV